MTQKLTNIFIIIMLAAGLLYGIDYLPEILGNKNTRFRPLPQNSEDLNPIYTDLNDQCDDMADGYSEKEDYQDIMMTIDVYADMEIITVSEASKLTYLANTSYAQSIVNSFDDWIDSDCGQLPSNIQQDINEVYHIPECQSMLNDELAAIQSFNYLYYTIPTRVQTFMNGKFDLSTYNTLVAQINSSVGNNHLRSCSNIATLGSTLKYKLDAFYTFAKGYEEQKEFYMLNESESRRLSFKRKYCPDYNANIKQYQYYYNDIQSMNVCY